jgi:hypothetical protein
VRDALKRDLEAARYAADRAFQQYDATDPANRPVAGELEARWNIKLCCSIIGARIDHLVDARPADPRCLSFDLERLTAKSPQSLYWADCVTFISVPHDGAFLRPTPVRVGSCTLTRKEEKC